MKKQVIIRLDEQTHRTLKAKTALNGLSIQEMLENCIDQYLKDKINVEPKPKSSYIGA